VLSEAITHLIRATGDADGLGEIRKKELVKSGLQLGIGSKDDILVVEDKYASTCTSDCNILTMGQELPRFHDSNMAPSSNLQSTHHRLRPKHDLNLFQGGTAGDCRHYNHL